MLRWGFGINEGAASFPHSPERRRELENRGLPLVVACCPLRCLARRSVLQGTVAIAAVFVLKAQAGDDPKLVSALAKAALKLREIAFLHLNIRSNGHLSPVVHSLADEA